MAVQTRANLVLGNLRIVFGICFNVTRFIRFYAELYEQILYHKYPDPNPNALPAKLLVIPTKISDLEY